MANDSENAENLNWLNRLASGQFSIYPGASLVVLDRIEKSFHVSLPTSYKGFLRFINGAEVKLYAGDSFITCFFPVDFRDANELTLSTMNLERGNSPLFSIGTLRADEFGFLWNDLSVARDDLPVYEFIDDQGEVCLLARSFYELIRDMIRTSPNENYTPPIPE